MPTIKNFSRFIAPVLAIFIGFIALIPNIYRELFSGWDRSEFYLTTLSQVIFLTGISYYIFKNSLSPHWSRKYFVNLFIFGFLCFYLYGSTFYDPAFPTLAALFIYSILLLLMISIVEVIIMIVIDKKSIQR